MKIPKFLKAHKRISSGVIALLVLGVMQHYVTTRPFGSNASMYISETPGGDGSSTCHFVQMVGSDWEHHWSINSKPGSSCGQAAEEAFGTR